MYAEEMQYACARVSLNVSQPSPLSPTRRFFNLRCLDIRVRTAQTIDDGVYITPTLCQLEGFQ